MCCAVSPGQDWDLVVLGTIDRHTAYRPYPQDLGIKIDKAKEKGSFAGFQLGKALRASCS